MQLNITLDVNLEQESECLFFKCAPVMARLHQYTITLTQ